MTKEPIKFDKVVKNQLLRVSVIPVKAGIRAPGSRRNLGGESPPPGDAHADQWDWVERTVWTDRMLEALDKGVKGGVWFSLIDKVRTTFAGQTNTFGTLGILAFTMPIVPCFSPHEGNHRPESRMREIRMSGSEGGEPG